MFIVLDLLNFYSKVKFMEQRGEEKIYTPSWG